MIPLPKFGFGNVEFPTVPPNANIPPQPDINPGFRNFYEKLLTAKELEAQKTTAINPIPGGMEVRPILEVASTQPFSKEFPQAVDPDGLLLPKDAVQKPSSANSADDSGSNVDLPAFLQPFKQGLMEVNQLGQNAKSFAQEAALGGDVDLHDVMIAAEKAGVATQLTVQVRNKVVEAYQEIMRMQV
jgi:flagellar hook-basal body complex protein FliE